MPETQHRAGRLARRALPYLALAILAVFIRVRVYPPDSAHYYAYAHSLLYDSDLSFVNRYGAFPFQPYELYLSTQDVPANDWPPGTGILWLIPMAWTALGQLLLNVAGLAGLPTGLDEASKLAAVLGSSLLGLLALSIPLRLRIHAGTLPQSTLLAVIAAVVVGTPFGYYLIVFPATSHVPSAALAACALGAWWRWSRDGEAGDPQRSSDRLAWAGLAGLSAGLLAVIRPQNVVFGVVPLLDLVLNRSQGVRVRPREVALALGAAVLSVAPILVVWHTLYGSWLALPKIEEMHWTHPTVLPFFFSSYHGNLSWAPLCLLCMVGLALDRRTWPFLAGVLAQLYVNACNEWWWAGGSFSNRRMVGCTPFLLIGLWCLFAQVKSSKRRWLTPSLTLASVLCCLWTGSLLLTEVGRRIRLDHCQYWEQIVNQMPGGIVAGIANLIPWDGMREHPWARLCVPLWIGLGIATAQTAFYALRKYLPPLCRVCNVARMAAIAAVGLCLWFGIAALRTSPAAERPEEWVNHSRFRWIYRYEEAHMMIAHNRPWEAIDAMLAGERIFSGYYQPWRAIGFSLMDRNQSYAAYFAFKEAISRGDRTNTRSVFPKLLQRLIDSHDEKRAAWWNELGVMLATQNQMKPAESAFETALALDPSYTRASENHRKIRWETEGADSGLAEADIKERWGWE